MQKQNTVVFKQDELDIKSYVCSKCFSVVRIRSARDFSKYNTCPVCKGLITKFICKRFLEVF